MPTNIFYPPLSNIVLPSDWPEELSFIEVGLTGSTEMLGFSTTIV